MADQDFYAALGVASKATQDEIKRAYRKLARKYHPDVAKGAGAAEKFRAAGAAYEVLRDPEKRKLYDQHGAAWENPPQPDPRHDWNGGFDFRREDVTGRDPEGFRQFFESGFGSRQGSGGPRGFAAQQAQIDVDLKDIFTGAEHTIALQMPKIDAQGRVTLQDKRLKVQIPKGMMPGQNLLLKGQGQEGADLILEVNVRPHPTYRIDGKDLSVDLPVTPWEAALGTTLDMPTPAGRIRVKVPAQARSGQKLRLKGRGLPGAQPGDLYAVLLIVNPPLKTKEQRALYEKMASEMAFDPRTAMKG